MKDIFGGTLDDERQNQDGHFWVGLDTDSVHCMTCRQGPKVGQGPKGEVINPCPGAPYCEVCGKHLDAHQGPQDHVFKRRMAL